MNKPTLAQIEAAVQITREEGLPLADNARAQAVELRDGVASRLLDAITGQPPHDKADADRLTMELLADLEKTLRAIDRLEAIERVLTSGGLLQIEEAF